MPYPTKGISSFKRITKIFLKIGMVTNKRLKLFNRWPHSPAEIPGLLRYQPEKNMEIFIRSKDGRPETFR